MHFENFVDISSFYIFHQKNISITHLINRYCAERIFSVFKNPLEFKEVIYWKYSGHTTYFGLAHMRQHFVIKSSPLFNWEMNAQP